MEDKPTTLEELQEEETSLETLTSGGRNVRVLIGRVVGPDFLEVPALPVMDVPKADEGEISETERRRRASVPKQVLVEQQKQQEERILTINRLLIEKGALEPKFWMGPKDECPPDRAHFRTLKEVELDELILKIMKFSGHRGLAKILPFLEAQGVGAAALPDGEGLRGDPGAADGATE